MLLKHEAYSEIKNKCSVPKMKYDQKVYAVVISCNIDNVPFYVVFLESNILSDAKLFCQKFSNLFKLYHPFI